MPDVERRLLECELRIETMAAVQGRMMRIMQVCIVALAVGLACLTFAVTHKPSADKPPPPTSAPFPHL